METKLEFIHRLLATVADQRENPKRRKKATWRENLETVVEDVDALIPQNEAEEMELQKFGFYPVEECQPFYTNKKKPFYFLDNMSLVDMSDTANMHHYGDFTFRQIEILFIMARMDNAEGHFWLKENLWRGSYLDAQQKRLYKNKFKGHEREDWKRIQTEWMRYCLNLKFRDNALFRRDLANLGDKFPVEDGTGNNYESILFWGVILVEFNGKKYYFGCNVLGKLLAQLRTCNGSLPYTLPEDMHLFGKPILDL